MNVAYSWYERFVTLSHLILAYFLVSSFLTILQSTQANYQVRAGYYEQISALSEPRQARKLDLGVFIQFCNVCYHFFINISGIVC
jgi:hypothetical protein